MIGLVHGSINRGNPAISQTTHDQNVILGAIQETREPLSALNYKSLSLVKSNSDLV